MLAIVHIICTYLTRHPRTQFCRIFCSTLEMLRVWSLRFLWLWQWRVQPYVPEKYTASIFNVENKLNEQATVPWRWKQNVAPKRRKIFTRLHDVILQKSGLFWRVSGLLFKFSAAISISFSCPLSGGKETTLGSIQISRVYALNFA
jgi:hypothetical protein